MELVPEQIRTAKQKQLHWIRHKQGTSTSKEIISSVFFYFFTQRVNYNNFSSHSVIYATEFWNTTLVPVLILCFCSSCLKLDPKYECWSVEAAERCWIEVYSLCRLHCRSSRCCLRVRLQRITVTQHHVRPSCDFTATLSSGAWSNQSHTHRSR